MAISHLFKPGPEKNRRLAFAICPTYTQLSPWQSGAELPVVQAPSPCKKDKIYLNSEIPYRVASVNHFLCPNP
jgi:hypothetical protein